MVDLVVIEDLLWTPPSPLFLTCVALADIRRFRRSTCQNQFKEATEVAVSVQGMNASNNQQQATADVHHHQTYTIRSGDHEEILYPQNTLNMKSQGEPFVAAITSRYTEAQAR